MSEQVAAAKAIFWTLKKRLKGRSLTDEFMLCLAKLICAPSEVTRISAEELHALRREIDRHP